MENQEKRKRGDIEVVEDDGDEDQKMKVLGGMDFEVILLMIKLGRAKRKEKEEEGQKRK